MRREEGKERGGDDMVPLHFSFNLTFYRILTNMSHDFFLILSGRAISGILQFMDEFQTRR